MQKKILNLVVVSILLLLSGCQTTTGNGSTMFTPFPFSPSSQVTLDQSVRDALMQTGDPVLAQVRVSMNQKNVVLSGYVKKIRQSDMAEQIAHKVPGVQVVENNLIVRQ